MCGFDAIKIQGKLITADALLTQRKLDQYLVQRGAHYHFTAKGNQATLQYEITQMFQRRNAPDFVELSPPDHGSNTRMVFDYLRMTGNSTRQAAA